MIYTPRYFIDLFTAIPPERWCKGAYTVYVGHEEQHCALGHCGVRPGSPSVAGMALANLFSRAGHSVDYVNDMAAEPRSGILQVLSQLPTEWQVNSSQFEPSCVKAG